MAESCYQPQYLPGSFKLVPFKAIEATSEHGRRGAEGEFPFGEQTGYADLGRRIRTYTISARFDSNDHILEAAALIAAVELPGAGPLVHPTRGVILSAACRSLRVRDRVEDEQGVTYVDMEFVEANNWPNGLSLVGQLLGLLINPVIASSEASFSSRYRPETIQSFREVAVVDAAQVQVQAVTDAYSLATTDKPNDTTRNRIISDLQAVVVNDDLARDTDTMRRALTLGMTAVSRELDAPDQYSVFRSIANGAARSSTFRAPASDAENAIYSHVRTVAAAYMARGVLDTDDLNTGEIFARGDVIETVIQGEMDYARQACENDLYYQLSGFRIEVAAQLARKAYASPGLIQYDFGGGVHPLVAAYSVYGDAKRHRELENLNAIDRYGRFRREVVARA
jgi:hypothetical protein